MSVREVPGLEFGEQDVLAFEPLVQTLELFVAQHKLEVSRIKDGDPVNPHLCYFLGWRSPGVGIGGRSWISVCAADPCHPGAEFNVHALGQRRASWTYQLSEGRGRLEEILDEAWSVATQPGQASGLTSAAADQPPAGG